MLGFPSLLKLLGRHYYPHLGVLAVVALIIAVLETVGVSALYPILDSFIRPDVFVEKSYVQWVQNFLNLADISQVIQFFILGALAVFIVKFLIIVLGKYISFRLTVGFQRALSLKFFTAYLNAPYAEVSKRSGAHYVEYIYQKLTLLVDTYLRTLVLLVSNVFITLGIGVLLFALNPLLFLSIAGVASVFLVGIRVCLRRLMRRMGTQFQKQRQENIRSLEQGLNPSKFRFISGKDTYFLNKYTGSLEPLLQAKLWILFFSEIPRYVLELIVVFLGLIGLYWLSLQEISLDNNLSVLAIYAVAGMRLLPIIGGMGTQYNAMMYLLPTLEALEQEMDLIRQMPQHGDGFLEKQEIPFHKEITFQNVSFQYGTETRILSDLSFSIQKGQKVAFVGGSGAGKTTLVDLLVGLYAPSEGDIRVDGVTIKDHLPSWWRKVAYIEQESHLIDGTLRQNIAYAEDIDQIDSERLAQAIEFAQLSELVASNPDGVDLNVGLDGGDLSGGQKQRIALARAFYCRADLIVLDESTSNLDSKTEYLITRLLQELKEVTIIMIAHRLSSVQGVDAVYFLDQGRISGVGGFKQLYQENAQFREYVDYMKIES